MFREFNWVWWASCATGAALGYLAGRIRAAGTQFEGNRWVLLLAGVAGAVVGAVTFVANLLFLVAFLSLSGWGNPGQMFAITLVILAVMFAAFVLRRRYE